jgi:hypothetical protein
MLSEFRSRFPQFSSTPDLIIEQLLLDAQIEWDPGIPSWSTVCCYTAAHWLQIETRDLSEQVSLTRSPKPGSHLGKSSYRSSNWDETGYGKRVIQLTNQYSYLPVI